MLCGRNVSFGGCVSCVSFWMIGLYKVLLEIVRRSWLR